MAGMKDLTPLVTLLLTVSPPQSDPVQTVRGGSEMWTSRLSQGDRAWMGNLEWSRSLASKQEGKGKQRKGD